MTVGVFGDEGTPVPIPNTEVKLISAENTLVVTPREDRAMPTQLKKPTVSVGFFLLCNPKIEIVLVTNLKHEAETIKKEEPRHAKCVSRLSTGPSDRT